MNRTIAFILVGLLCTVGCSRQTPAQGTDTGSEKPKIVASPSPATVSDKHEVAKPNPVLASEPGDGKAEDNTQPAGIAKPDQQIAVRPEPPVGKWEEVREVIVDGKKESRNRIRDFRPDGTLVLLLSSKGKTNAGTWKREGDRISFSLPATDDTKAENKWFTIIEANDATMTILMEGERRYTWTRLDQVKPVQEKRKDDLALLQGKWQTILKVGPKGKQLAADDPRHNQVLEVEGNTLRLTIQQSDAKSLSGTFKLTPTEHPKAFDLVGTGPLGFEIEQHGIYELSEDTFRLSVIQCGKGKPFTRPLEFTGPQGGDYFVFKRLEVAQQPKKKPDTKAGPAAYSITELKTLQGHSEPIQSLAFSPDSKLLITGDGGGRPLVTSTVKLWSVPDGKELKSWGPATWELKKDADLPPGDRQFIVTSFAFSSDGKRLAIGTGGPEARVHIFDTESWNRLSYRHWFTPGADVSYRTFVTYSPDNATLAVGLNQNPGVAWVWSGDIYLLDAKTNKEKARLGPWLEVGSLSFSPDGKQLATGSSHSVVLIDFQSRKNIGPDYGDDTTARSVAFSPNGKFLAGGYGDRLLFVDLENRKLDEASRNKSEHPAAKLQWPSLGKTEIRSIAFSPNGNLIAVGSSPKSQTTGPFGKPQGYPYSGELSLWSVNPLTKIQSIDVKGFVPGVDPGKLMAVSPPMCVAFSPDGSYLAVGWDNRQVKLYKVGSAR